MLNMTEMVQDFSKLLFGDSLIFTSILMVNHTLLVKFVFVSYY